MSSLFLESGVVIKIELSDTTAHLGTPRMRLTVPGGPSNPSARLIVLVTPLELAPGRADGRSTEELRRRRRVFLATISWPIIGLRHQIRIPRKCKPETSRK